MRATSHAVAFAGLLLSSACGKPDRPATAACGIASLAGPTLLLSEFGVPGQTLATAPDRLPEQIAVRAVAGPVYRGIVGRADSRLIVGVEGTLPAAIKPGFGVLIVDQGRNSARCAPLRGRSGRKRPDHRAPSPWAA